MCRIEGCNNDKILAKGLCNKHYKQIYRHGKIIKTIYEPNDIEYFDSHAEIILRTKYGEECCRAIVDLEDVELISRYKWCYNGQGYAICRETGLFMHKLIMGDNNNEYTIDHINRIRHDNRKSNLRYATIQENARNKSIQHNNTSGVPGVSWRKDRNKWRAYITITGKQITLGLFEDKNDAINARKKAEEKYFGEFTPKYDN